MKICRFWWPAWMPAYPPFGFKDSKTGEFVGFDVDIIRAIGRTAGFSVKVENIPFDGLIPALKTRTIDIAINDIGITAERAKSVDFSDRYYIAGMGIVVAKGYQGIQSCKRFGRQTARGNDRIDRRNRLPNEFRMRRYASSIR